jgi:hypothetical protein
MRVAIGQSERFLYGHYGWKTLEIIVQVDNKKQISSNWGSWNCSNVWRIQESSGNYFFAPQKNTWSRPDDKRGGFEKTSQLVVCIYIYIRYTYYTMLYTEINHTTTSFVGDLVFFGRTIDHDCPFVILDLFKEAVLRKAPSNIKYFSETIINRPFKGWYLPPIYGNYWIIYDI